MSKNLRIFVAIIASTLLGGCAGLGLNLANKETAKPGTDVYRGKYSFVRIEPAEVGVAGVAPNQARALDVAQLRGALALLKGKQNSFAGKPLFTPKELAELVVPLSTALGKAAPGEDVVFAITGVHGGVGLMMSQSVTTGRAFIRDGKLNVIFGMAQFNFEDELLGNNTLRPFVPGSRSHVVSAEARIEGLGWTEVVPGRSDWLAISLEALPAKAPARDTAAKAAPAAAGAASEESLEADRASAVERRLEVLERLKQKGLISDEEYRDKRRVILMDL